MTETARARRLNLRRIAPWSINLILVAVGALLSMAALALDSSAPSWPWFAVLFVLHIAVSSLPLNLEVRRHSVLVAANEIPLILALFYLSPFWAIAVRVGAAASMSVFRSLTGRSAGLKSLFNTANQGVCTAAAALVAHAFGLGAATSPGTWLVLSVAVLVSLIISALNLTVIVAVSQGLQGNDVLVGNLVAGAAPNAVNAALGILTLIIVDATLWAVLPLLVLAVVMAGAYSGYSRLIAQRRSLADLNDFTQSVSQAVQSERLVDIMTHRLRDMLNAESATVWVPADKRFPELLLTAYLDVEGLLDTTPVPMDLRRHVLDSGEALLVAPREGAREHRDLLRSNGVKDTIIVPLRSGTVSYGCLAVSNRLGGDLLVFDRSDMSLLETLASHAGVAVENSRLVDRLRFDAYHDALTKLPNRHRIMNILEDAISITVPGEIVVAMLFDVDGMRQINESVGHAAGDQLIIEVGNRIRQAAPDAAHVGRIDGDEFALIMRIPDTDAAVALATRMREAVQAPYRLGDLNVDIDSAVGIAVHPESSDRADTLLQRAEVATQTAKNVAGGIQVYNVSLESTSVRRLGLATDLRHALEAGELSVQFQPKISLTERRIVGVECLARWRHPAHGDVAPEDFVPVAEHTGQLGKLTEFVLREGLSRVSSWAAQGYELGVSVNLAPRTLTDTEFPQHVATLLDEYDVPPGRLTFELTENDMIGSSDRAPRTLHRLRELGVRLSVDDFGKGYSSLAYLRRLPVQEIKIDRGFVQGMATDEGDYAIVRAVVDLARHFRMTVVAEGVESEMTLGQLTEIGCDIAQGFYFSRPLTPDRFDAWLAAQHGEGDSPRRLRAV